MKGLIAAARFSVRLLNLCDRQNKVLSDLDVSPIWTHFEHPRITDLPVSLASLLTPPAVEPPVPPSRRT